MVKLARFILTVGVGLLLTACPEPLPEKDTSLKIVNNSEEDILWLFGFEQDGEWYEISSINPWIEKFDIYRILRGKTYVDSFNSDGVQFNLRKGWIKYYLFNYDSISTIPWQRICDERIILKEVVFNSWEDYERCNFEITYP